jgi:N-acetylmuramoyl-L-alanine amidase/uncharacterized protein YgiM (DUF1202 family)
MNKKTILLLLAFCIFFGSLPYVQSKTIVKIYQATNIRMSPSVDAKVLARIQPPKDLNVISETKDKSGKTWFEVEASPGKKGFVASWVVKVQRTGTEEKIDGQVAVIDPNSGIINLRSSPNTSSSVALQIKTKIELPVVAKTKGDDGKDWYKLSLGNGRFGWIGAGLIDEIKSTQVAKEEVKNLTIIIDPLTNLRSGPSTKSPVVNRTTSTIRPSVVAKSKDADGKIWYEIVLPTGTHAWVRSDLAKTATPILEESTSKQKGIISKNVNVRKDAGLNFAKVYTTKSQVVVQILSKKSDVNGKMWLKVQGDFGVGWVLGSMVETTSSSPFDIVAAKAQLRLAPSQGGKLLGVVPRESKCTISGSALNSDGGTWYLLTTQQGETGWVTSTKVKTSGSVDLPPANLLGLTVELQKESTLASFPSGSGGPKIFAGGKGKVESVAQREGGRLYYRILSGNQAGWVSSEDTKRHTQPQPVKPVDVGEIQWAKRGDVLKFTIPISSKPNSMNIKSYNDNPRIQLFLDNSFCTGDLEPIVVDSTLVSRVGIEQKSVSPPTVLVVFQLNKPCDYHLSPLNPTSTELVLEIFEKVESNQMRIEIQGRPVHASDPPILLDNKVMVPVGALASHLGYIISWDDKENRAEMSVDPKRPFVFSFTNLKPSMHVVDGQNSFYKTIAPAPRIVGSAFYVPIEPVAPMLGFSYMYSPVQNKVYLDPVIDKLEIGGCLDTSKACSTLSTQVSFFTDFDVTELPDGRSKVTLNNCVLGENALSGIDAKKVSVDFDPRTNANPPKVTILITKKSTEEIGYGEARGPNKLIFTLKEKNKSGLNGKTIIIDPGHGTFNEDGSYDVGCSGMMGTYESEVNLQTAFELGKMLSSQGATVLYTRNEERNIKTPDLEGRASFANSSGADMFVSIHFNAARDPDAQGTETYYYTDLGRRLAEKIHKNVLSKVGFEDRGIKKRGFYVCREIVSIPSILIEPLFLSNKKGEGWIREEVNVKKLAEGIQLGIKEFFQEPI